MSIVLAALAAAGAGSAVISGDQIIWAARPEPNEIGRVYPKEAAFRSIQGNAQLLCEMEEGVIRACTIIAENPTGYGFGEAALKMSKFSRAKPKLKNGEPATGQVRLGTNFGFPPYLQSKNWGQSQARNCFRTFASIYPDLEDIPNASKFATVTIAETRKLSPLPSQWEAALELSLAGVDTNSPPLSPEKRKRLEDERTVCLSQLKGPK